MGEVTAALPAGLQPLRVEEMAAHKHALEAGGQWASAFYYPFLLSVDRSPKRSVVWSGEPGGRALFVLSGGKHPRLDLFAPPLPADPASLARALELANDYNGDRSARVYWIDQQDLSAVREVAGLRERFREEEYLYRPADYADLSGGAFRTLRRNLSRVEALDGLAVAPFRAEDSTDCLALLDEWERGQGRKYASLRDRGYNRACIELAPQLPDTDLRGEVIRIDGQLRAFAFGGELRAGLGVFFIAKADPQVRGLSYFQRYHFLSAMAECPLVNDSSDMGSEGLRQLKRSLRPAAMHALYNARQERRINVPSAAPGEKSGLAIRHRDPRHYAEPEQWMPLFQAGDAERTLLARMREAIRASRLERSAAAGIDRAFADSRFPQRYERLILILYAPGHQRILVSRDAHPALSAVMAPLFRHPRLAALAAAPFRLQLDFVVEPPAPVALEQVGMSRRGERHFEVGLDGLLLRGADGRLHIFTPGDAYVRSTLGMGQLRDYLRRVHGEPYLAEARCERFRSASFVCDGEGWARLYRGHPVVGALGHGKLARAVELAVDHIQRTQQADGRFLYYYDAAADSRRDHEHPKRDPERNPFYNILRHGGGGLTCAYFEKWSGRGTTLENIRRAIDFLVAQTRVQEYAGREGAYIFHERKAKLGGSGIALYLLAEYQRLSGDDRYREWAERIAWHLRHQITASGEFIYYNVYLDQPVSEAENGAHFSFYYPGEAVCGLAKYLHLVAEEERGPWFAALHRALHYLIEVRPGEHAEHYTALPSDSWLMMGIMELWDFAPMRDPRYAEFVFTDAATMVDHLYKVSDAPYPDYAGGFHYQWGDFPYTDGARCEGLLGAYELARKMGEEAKARDLWRALRLAAWALLQLVNDETAIYHARNPRLALGGIRFKQTRQWFRIDTIQHVASFFAKLLPHWEREEGGAP
ncbi:hypothetical protein [Endothiovibrio diazotrophicus]